jgi:hypothetical protein
MTGQEQFGAVTTRVFAQLPSDVVIVIFVPDGTPVIDHTLLPVYVTVPEELVTVPVLAYTASE